MAVVATSGARPSRQRRRYVVAVLATLLVVVGGLVAAGFTGGSGGLSGATSATPAVPKALERPGITGMAGRWRLLLNATFGGSRLDTSLWHTCYGWGCTIATNPEDEWYQAANDAVHGGLLTLTAKRQQSHGRAFTSGMIQSNGSFDFRYGVIEVRAKVPEGNGTWPAIWMVPANQSWPPEIDLMELWGNEPGQVRVSLHFGTNDQVDDRLVNGGPFTAGFHTYAVDWEPNGISWYIDGHLVYHTATSVSAMMYPIVNLAVASAPPPTLSSFPARMQVQWVRVWQHPGIGASSCTVAACRS